MGRLPTGDPGAASCYPAWKGRGVEVIGVSFDDDTATVLAKLVGPVDADAVDAVLARQVGASRPGHCLG